MRGFALIVCVVLGAAACTQSTNNVSNNSPAASLSQSPTASPSPSTVASPTAAASPATIAGLPLAQGEVGIAYSANLSASGGATPYTFTVTSGALPNGLTLGSDGSISGIPTAAGTSNFVVQATDAQAQFTTKAAVITVHPPLAVVQPCAVLCNIGAGCMKCGSFGSAAGGVGPYRFAITSGAVPKGMTLNGLALTGPFPAGSYSLTVSVTDAAGAQASVSANWQIYGAFAMNAGTSCTWPNANIENGCTVTGWTYASPNPFAQPELVVLKYSQYCNPQGFCYPVSTGLPAGWSASVKGGSINISIAAQGCSANPYEAVLTIAIKDVTQCATTSLPTPLNLTLDLENGC